MYSDDRYQDGNTIPKLMTLPEEILHEIISYLSLETLCSSLRKVCKKIKLYVDHYLKVGRTFHLVGRQEGSESEAIEYIQMPNKGIIIIWKPVSYIPYDSFYLQTDKNWDEHEERLVEKVIFTTLDERIVFHFSEGGKCMIYRHNPETDRWKKLFENFTPFRCIHHGEPSHHCIGILSFEESPYYVEKHGNFLECSQVLFESIGSTTSQHEFLIEYTKYN